MPRRPTSDDAVRASRFFLEGFIECTDSEDHILPKNDNFSPFSGFCRVFPEFAKKKDGGSATDGVSRAAFNKICLEYFEEGMRKPARNGNPGSLESGLAQQRRHFLRGRWRDPSMLSDSLALKALFSSMTVEQGASSRALLEDFSRWKPGPAGRRGKRCSDDGSEDDIDGEDQSPYSAGAEFPVYSSRDTASAMLGKVEMGEHADLEQPPRKRLHSARELHVKRDIAHGGDPGPLELLCNVAFNSDHMPGQHLVADHLGMLDAMHHDADFAPDRVVKGEGDIGNSWHAHELEARQDLEGARLPLVDDEVAIDTHHDLDHAHRSLDHPHRSLDHPHRSLDHPYRSHHQHMHYHSHAHSCGPAHPMHRMPMSMGVEYGLAVHPYHAHYMRDSCIPAYHPPHNMRDCGPVSRIGEGPRDLTSEMLRPHRRVRLGLAINALSASARPLRPAPSALGVGVGGVTLWGGGDFPSHSHKSPRHGPVPHKSPRHAPHGGGAGGGGHPTVTCEMRHSPHHGPVRKSPHIHPQSHQHASKSPHHVAAGHPSENRGEMLPPSTNGNWMKSPGLGHVKPKKIPGSVASILETPPLNACRTRNGMVSEPSSFSLGDPSLVNLDSRELSSRESASFSSRPHHSYHRLAT